jgi:hypothetical protein
MACTAEPPAHWYYCLSKSVSNEIIGKGLGWEMEFCRQEKDYARIRQILDLIKIVNADKPIYMEGGWMDGNGMFC